MGLKSNPKYTMLILAVFPAVAVIGLVYLIGIVILPASQKAEVHIRINAPAQRVWKILTAWQDQPQWRLEIERVELKSENEFVEYPKRGGPIHFRVAYAEPPIRFGLEMTGAVKGTYAIELIESAGVTVARATEKIVVENPFQRILIGLFFNLEDFAGHFLKQLKTQAEKTN